MRVVHQEILGVANALHSHTRRYVVEPTVREIFVSSLRVCVLGGEGVRV